MNTFASRASVRRVPDRLLSRSRSSALSSDTRSLGVHHSPFQSWQRRSTDSQSSTRQNHFRLSTDNIHKGRLGKGDRFHPHRQNRHVDLFSLGRVRAGETIEISLHSNAFDPVLRLVERRSHRTLDSNDDRSKGDRDSYIRFEAEKRSRYQIQVTSFDADATGRYRLKVKTSENASTPTFNYRAGYGLVDAAAAVAAARRVNPTTNLPDVSNLWGLDAIKAPEVWAQGFTGKGVVVAVLDTGVNYNHKDLKGNIWRNPGEIAGNGIDDDNNGYIDDVQGWKFVDTDTNNPMDLDGHGTHVAGTIAAKNNGFGVTGVAHKAKIMPVKVIDGRDDGSTQKFDQNLAAGIRYAVDNGAQVINMSLGTFIGEPTLTETRKALKYAYKAGAIAIMAAGNNGTIRGVNSPIEPAAFASNNLGIAVGAIKENRTVANFSNPAGNNPLPFLVGPGVKIRSTVLGNQYANFSGTSMASPHIAGVVALMLDANPNLTPDQVREILVSTANSDGVKLT